MDTIPKQLAGQQEIRVRKLFGMQLILSGICLFVVLSGTALGFGMPVTILCIMLVMFFFIQNQKELNRLMNEYGK